MLLVSYYGCTQSQCATLPDPLNFLAIFTIVIFTKLNVYQNFIWLQAFTKFPYLSILMSYIIHMLAVSWRHFFIPLHQIRNATFDPNLCDMFLAATKQLYDWFSPSVRLSVRHTFFTMFPSSYHHEIFRNYFQWQKWRPCKRSRSKVKVTEVNTQLNPFRTVTLVWIHIWWWNDAYSLMMLRRGALLFFKVIREISRSHSS